MSQVNTLWSAPRLHSELLKLGLTVAQRTVAKYMVRGPHCSPCRWQNIHPAGGELLLTQRLAARKTLCNAMGLERLIF